MASTKIFTALLFLSALHPFVKAVDTTRNPTLDQQLFTAATSLDALALIPGDESWVFDFRAQPSYTYSPGSVVNANAATFPAAVRGGLTMAMLNLGPCAMLPPHFHPRADNYVVAIEGTTNTYMFQENGAHLINETLTPGKMTIFPKGSVHSMQNTGCGNATLVSALDTPDTGTTNLVNSLWQLPAEIIAAAFGNPTQGSPAYDVVRNLAAIGAQLPPIGTGSILGSAECLAACKAGKAFTGP